MTHCTGCSISSDPAPNQGLASHLLPENWATYLSCCTLVGFSSDLKNGFLTDFTQSDLNWKWKRRRVGRVVGGQLSRFKLATARLGQTCHWSKPRKVSGLRIWNVPTNHKTFYLWKETSKLTQEIFIFTLNIFGLENSLLLPDLLFSKNVSNPKIYSPLIR